MDEAEPEDKDFVAKVRAEIAEARRRAFEMLEREDPSAKKRPRAPYRRRARSAKVAERREIVLTGLLCGKTPQELAAELDVAYATIIYDTIELRREHGARNLHHLTAIVSMDIAAKVAVKHRRPAFSR